jgi:hypothetical protein
MIMGMAIHYIKNSSYPTFRDGQMVMGIAIHYIKNSSYPTFRDGQMPNHICLLCINRTERILNQLI